MSDHEDKQLDARLRDVPVPVDIAGRVMPVALFDDVAIDRLLVRVETPPGLAERVRQATAAMRAGVAQPLAEKRPLSTGSPPAGARCFPAAGRRIRLWSVTRELLVDGVAVAAALSIVGLMFFAGTELSRRMASSEVAMDRAAVRRAGPRPAVSALESAMGGGREAEPRPHDAVHGGVENRSSPIAESGGGSPAAVAATSPVDAGKDGSPMGVPSSRSAALEVRAAPAAPPVPRADRGAARGDIQTVSLPRVGRRVPHAPGYDIAFEMAHGESPFIDPSAAASLVVDHPPVSLRTDSFDSVCAAVFRDRGRAAGRRARRGVVPLVRTEEILAALPAPKGATAWPADGTGPELRLSIDAVRSLRPAAGSMFVEVCASARPVRGDGSPSAPLDVMLMLDQSAGPFGLPSWQWLCRSVGRVIEQMSPADRLSLIVCGERPRLAALRADGATLSALLPELMAEPPTRSADVDAAFRLAAAVGRREGRPERIVVAAHAPTVEQCRREGRDALAAWQADSAAGGSAIASTSFVLIDPLESPISEGRSWQGTQGTWLTSGRVEADPVAISRALSARIFGRPTQVATDCRLEVAFDPSTVRSYRIVGYRQTAADALAADDRRGDELHAGETLRVVYELVRRQAAAEASGPAPVSATLSWRPAGAPPEDRHSPRIQRQSLTAGSPGTVDLHAALPSPHGCELLLAVALGELAAASVHAEPWRHPTTGIAGLASRWQARGDVTRIGTQLIECLRYQSLISDASSR